MYLLEQRSAASVIRIQIKQDAEWNWDETSITFQRCACEGCVRKEQKVEQMKLESTGCTTGCY